MRRSTCSASGDRHNRGELTPVKFGNKTLFYAADLAAFLMRLRAATTLGQPRHRSGTAPSFGGQSRRMRPFPLAPRWAEGRG